MPAPYWTPKAARLADVIDAELEEGLDAYETADPLDVRFELSGTCAPCVGSGRYDDAPCFACDGSGVDNERARMALLDDLVALAPERRAELTAIAVGESVQLGGIAARRVA